MKKIIVSLLVITLFVGSASAQTTTLNSTTFTPAYTTPKDLFQHMQNEIDGRIKDVTASYAAKSLTNGLSQSMTTLQWNPNVWTNKGTPIDFTGIVMWSDYTPPTNGGYNSHFWRAGTLISPSHLIFASHIPLEVGKKVRFYTKAGEAVERTVTNSISIPPYGALGTDITVAVLDTPVPSTITYYPILSKAEWKQAFKNEIPDEYQDKRFTLPIIYLDQEKKVSVTTTYKKSLYDDANNITHGSAIETGKRKDFYESLVGGDSGYPTFVLIGAKPVLISSHTTTAGGPNYSYYYDQINDAMKRLGGGYKLSTVDLSAFTSGATLPRPKTNFATGLTLTSEKTVFKVADSVKAKVSFTISPEWTTWLKNRNQNQGEVSFNLRDSVGKVLINKKYAFDINKPNQVIDFDWQAQSTETNLNGKRFSIEALVTADTVYETATVKDLAFERNILIVKNSGTGIGNIKGTGIDCGSDCAELINFGTSVTLTATPATGSKFTGWSGACTGMTCTVTTNAEKVEAIANFDKNSTGTQNPTTPTPNRRPVAVNGTYTAFDDSFNINLTGSDLDYNPLTFTPSKTVLTYGDLTKTSEGKYVYTIKRRPTVDGAKDIFTFTVSDGKDVSKEDGVITISVPKAAGVINTSSDSDSDGIVNSSDLCPNTPSSLRNQINSTGCIPPKISSFDIRSTLSSDLRTVSGFELGKTGLGKIKFKDDVTLSRDSGQIDIDSNVTINQKSVHIESNSIPELNKPATITLYNVTEENPRILKDGKVCEAPQCVIESYSGGVLVFTVKGFSTYTIEETPKEVQNETKKEKKKENSSAPSSSKSDVSNAELIRVLTIQLNLLIAELNRLTGNTMSGSFTADLSIGVSHPDVLKLQKFLNSKGLIIASSGPGSPGNETDFYGAKTADAVRRFQMSKGIQSTGNVGPLTRAALNAI